MKDKGYTLIELLGVIIILAVLIVLIFPSLINFIKNSSNDVDELTLDLIYNASNLYISEHSNDFSMKKGYRYIIELKELVAEGFLNSPIILSSSDDDITADKCIQVIVTNDEYQYELKDSGQCEQVLSSLPREYQQVEYIESDGTQYIDTNVYADNNTGINIDFSALEYLARENANQFTCFVFGGESNWINSSFDFQAGVHGLVYNTKRLGSEYNTVTLSNKNTDKHTLKIFNGRYYFDGQFQYNLTEFNTTNWKSDTSIILFGVKRAGAIQRLDSSRIYGCQLYDGEELIRDFVPCYRKSDNVIGMYDLINDVFYPNEGTGTFKKGVDV